MLCFNCAAEEMLRWAGGQREFRGRRDLTFRWQALPSISTTQNVATLFVNSLFELQQQKHATVQNGRGIDLDQPVRRS